MPEPLKNYFSERFVKQVAEQTLAQYADFNAKQFVNNILASDWQELELKQRMSRIATFLGVHLPSDYPTALKVLLPVAENFSGLAHMCFAEYVEQYGLEYFELSMQALEALTENSSSEFAVRPFITQYPKQSMNQMAVWSKSKNKHVRRLASEGCRPRLPWAMALPSFKQDPSQVLKVILGLIDDSSLYVRRSVANNLNDISKDNPDVIVEVAKQYYGQSKQTDWVIKHACRTLLKQGHNKVLELFGYKAAKHINLNHFEVSPQVKLGEKLTFSFSLHTLSDQLGMLRLEFKLYFLKANGSLSGKVFKITEGKFEQKTKQIEKSFSFKPITTRKYYLGTHSLSILVNGEEKLNQEFELIQ